MPASPDLRLIAKIADVGELKPVLDAGITARRFKDNDARLMYEFILQYYKRSKTNGDVPTRTLLEEHYPTVDLPPQDRISLHSVINDFMNRDMKSRVQQLLDYMIEGSDSPSQMLPKAQATINEILKARRTSVDLVVADSLHDARVRYEEAKNRDVLKGIPYPWKVLNYETQGMQPGEYIIFYGRPKSMKTFVGLKVAVHAYGAARRRVLVYTREMSPQQMMDRTLCMLLHAPYDAFKKGYLDQIEHPCGGTMEDAFYGLLQTLKGDEQTVSIGGKHASLIITSDRQDVEGGGVSGLRRKIEDYGPDLVFVDAVYLMRNDRNGVRSVKWSDQAAISQDLKEIAQDFNLPLVATLQANRGSEQAKGESASNMAYADAYAQDCDLGCEIIKKRIDAGHNELALAITATRETNMAGFAIHGDPCENFGMLYKPVTEHGVAIMIDGKEKIEPVIFQETSDIWKMFKKPREDEEGGFKKKSDAPNFHNKGPNRKIPTKEEGMGMAPKLFEKAIIGSHG